MEHSFVGLREADREGPDCGAAVDVAAVRGTWERLAAPPPTSTLQVPPRPSWLILHQPHGCLSPSPGHAGLPGLETQSYRCFSPEGSVTKQGTPRAVLQPCLTSQGTILNAARRRSACRGSREPPTLQPSRPQRGRDAQGGSACTGPSQGTVPVGKEPRERVLAWLGRGGRSRHRRALPGRPSSRLTKASRQQGPERLRLLSPGSEPFREALAKTQASRRPPSARQRRAHTQEQNRAPEQAGSLGRPSASKNKLKPSASRGPHRPHAP